MAELKSIVHISFNCLLLMARFNPSITQLVIKYLNAEPKWINWRICSSDLGASNNLDCKQQQAGSIHMMLK